jgi:hypothetical protein
VTTVLLELVAALGAVLTETAGKEFHAGTDPSGSSL